MYETIHVTIPGIPVGAEYVDKHFHLGPRKSASMINKCPRHWVGTDGKSYVMLPDFVAFMRENTHKDFAPPVVETKPAAKKNEKAKDHTMRDYVRSLLANKNAS